MAATCRKLICGIAVERGIGSFGIMRKGRTMEKKMLVVLILLLCTAGLAAAALVNVSQGKPATSSSQWNADAGPSKVTDGATTAGWPIFHSGNGDYDPWVMVDLQQVELIKEITVWNRQDCCQVRMQDLQVEILDANQHIVVIAGIINPGNVLGSPQSATLTLDDTIPGQYVRVRRIPNPAVNGSTEEIDHHDDFILSLNELQVFADDEVPSIPANPSPYPGEIDVPIEVTLSWDTSILIDPDTGAYPNPAVTAHAVYLSSGKVSDPNVVWLADVPAGDPVASRASYGPITLERDGVYYWRVDEIGLDPNGEPTVLIEGPVWRFDTILSLPSITLQPVKQLVDTEVTASVDFVVEGSNPFYPGGTLTGPTDGLGYQWQFDDGSGFVDLPGATDATLTVTTDLGDGHEGRYRCVVSILDDGTGNPASGTATSDAAWLLYKRLVGHWPFDSDFTDAAGDNDGTPTAASQRPFTPEIRGGDAALVGDGAAFFSSTYAGNDENPAGGAVVIPTPYFLLENNSFSISFWEKSDSTESSRHFVASGADDTGIDNFFMWRYVDPPNLYMVNIGPWAGSYPLSTDPVAVPEDEWHLATVTYDADTQEAALYVDGVVADTATVTTFVGFAPEFYVGNRKNMARPFSGSIDELMIYSYALDPVEVAQAYVDVMGGTVCTSHPLSDISGPEGEPDCKTDIHDLAKLASAWLTHGFFPVRNR